MVIDVEVFEKKLNELRDRRLKSIDAIYSLDTFKDMAKMFYQAGISEAKSAIILALVEEENDEK